ncbi:MAG TPA: hypothetical protein VMH04_20345 [Candidatus Solibacter sp.]|nr:hypothetical protein [Candidatus Solibacter sp.]
MKLCALLLVALAIIIPASAQNEADSQSKNPGIGTVTVTTALGGQIFGFDVDASGTEGLLTEAQTLSNGNTLNAVETFDQATGKIIQIVKQSQTKDEDVTLGVASKGVGLVEHDHVTGVFVTSRTYRVLNPVSSNKFDAVWTPGLAQDDIILQVSRSQGQPNNAVFAFENGGDDHSFVFSTNIAKNTVGPFVTLTDTLFDFGTSPQMAYNYKTNQAILAASTGAVFGPPPTVAIADLTSGTVTEFTGVGAGFINGLAVDSVDGVACTTTELDVNVEFYDLANQTGFPIRLPNATNQLQSGADVEFDPVHKLFFVAQPVSSSAASGSTIYIFNPKGSLVRTMNGFNFSNASAVIPVHIALNPKTRSGYVDGPTVNQLQSFTY